MITAAFFDLDGTLVRTEPLKAKAHAETVRAFGGDVTPLLYAPVMGRSFEEVRDHFCLAGKVTVSAREYEAFFRATYRGLRDRETQPTEGMPELVAQLAARQVHLGIVTSSDAQTTAEIIGAAGFYGTFATIVTRADVRRHKPAPEGYLLAMARAGVEPKAAVAFEDSEAGVAAARAAGMRVVAVRHELNAAHDFRGVDRILTVPISPATLFDG